MFCCSLAPSHVFSLDLSPSFLRYMYLERIATFPNPSFDCNSSVDCYVRTKLCCSRVKRHLSSRFDFFQKNLILNFPTQVTTN